jgi:hypothetical protein
MTSLPSFLRNSQREWLFFFFRPIIDKGSFKREETTLSKLNDKVVSIEKFIGNESHHLVISRRAEYSTYLFIIIIWRVTVLTCFGKAEAAVQINWWSIKIRIASQPMHRVTPLSVVNHHHHHIISVFHGRQQLHCPIISPQEQISVLVVYIYLQ